MLGDAVHLPEEPSMDQVSSPFSPEILEFIESELFPEIQNSEVASSSNCCYDDQSSYTTNIKAPTNLNLSGIFEEEITENHLNLPRYQFSHQDQFDLSLLQNPLIPLATDHNGQIAPAYPHPPHPNDHLVPILGVCEDDCLSSMPPSKFLRIDPLVNSYLSGNSNPPLPVDSSGMSNGSLFQPHELDFKGDNIGGIFCPDPLPRPYNSNELQTHSNESQNHLVNGGGGSCATPLASEITSLEAETFRVTSKLTTEERKEKIHRYMKKRNERNFSKKIKYACRKTLADSRPRVRGRFAKNDEFGENIRTTCSNHDEEFDEDVVVKEEDDNLESSDIFAHISGVNSFKFNYPIQSWI